MLFDTFSATLREQLPAGGREALMRLDGLIDQLADILAEQDAARIVLVDTEAELAIREASAALNVLGGNAESRKAAVVFMLRDDPAYQQLRTAAGEARATIHRCDGRYRVLREQIELVHAALALLGTARTHH